MEKGKDMMKGWTKKERQDREWQNEVLARLDPLRELEKDELDLNTKRLIKKQQERERVVLVTSGLKNKQAQLLRQSQTDNEEVKVN